MEIRRARPSESAALTALAHRAKAAWGYPADWMARWRDELTLTADYVAAHPTFVAVSDDDAGLVGTCAIQDMGTHWSLDPLWISPDHQRRGIGQALVAHARERARASRPGAMEILSDPNAEAFYLKLGAVRVGEEPAPMPGAPERALPKLRFREA